MKPLTPVGVPPYDYPGASYDPALWAEVDALPPVEIEVEVRDRDGRACFEPCVNLWVYYADLDRWLLDWITGPSAVTSAEAMAIAISLVPEMETYRREVLQENATVIDA